MIGWPVLRAWLGPACGAKLQERESERCLKEITFSLTLALTAAIAGARHQIQAERNQGRMGGWGGGGGEVHLAARRPALSRAAHRS